MYWLAISTTAKWSLASLREDILREKVDGRSFTTCLDKVGYLVENKPDELLPHIVSTWRELKRKEERGRGKRNEGNADNAANPPYNP